MMESWHNELRRQASLHHMCEENRRALACIGSKSDAIELYKKTIDWALEEGYPSIDVLRRHFSDCGEMGVFVDKTFHGELLDDNLVYVFHNCHGTIHVGLNLEKKLIPMLYFANGCDMSILGDGSESPVRVPLYVFGGNVIDAKNAEDIEFLTFKFDVK